MKNLLLTTLSFFYLVTLSSQSIFRTACNGNVENLDSMLVNTSVDLKDDRGKSLLHWAVACKQKEVFDLLINKGIELNAIDDQEQTPLHIAVQFNNVEYCEYLIELQTNDTWQSLYGASLLELAILNNSKELTEILINSGVDINIKNNRGSTALEISQRLGADHISELLISRKADEGLVRKFNIRGEYMGMEKPGLNAQMFAPNFISTEEEEFGSVFSKDGTEFFFGVHTGQRNEIRYSMMRDGNWSKPKTIVSWSEPINAGSNINTSGDEYYISFTDAGTMFFASDGHPRKDSSRSDHDIYYAKYIDNEFQEPVLLDSAVNTSGYEADVFVAPDESYLIFCSTRDGGYGKGDLYISFKDADENWTDAINMGVEINSEHYEYCPSVTKDGKYLFYTSNQDIYWVDTEIINDLEDRNR